MASASGAVNKATYYRDHWLEIDAQRLGAYQQLFQWHPAMEPLLAAAEIAPGQVVVDYGYGPGGLAVELARRVADGGHVHGVELNETFVAQARENLSTEGFSETTTVHHITDDRVPLGDGAADRLVCKNVLEYVTHYDAVIAEFYRVVKPGGIVHVIDSDWGMMALEPLGRTQLAELIEAASCAYKTPLIGRLLYSELKKAGFAQVAVKIITSADIRGRMLPVLVNMIEYARVGGMSKERADDLLGQIKRAVVDQTFMFVLPQFLVTAIK